VHQSSKGVESEPRSCNHFLLAIIIACMLFVRCQMQLPRTEDGSGVPGGAEALCNLSMSYFVLGCQVSQGSRVPTVYQYRFLALSPSEYKKSFPSGHELFQAVWTLEVSKHVFVAITELARVSCRIKTTVVMLISLQCNEFRDSQRSVLPSHSMCGLVGSCHNDFEVHEL
jgi:hypothetical protein